MKYKLIILGCLTALLLTQQTYGQKNPSFIGIHVGTALPLGNWSKSDFLDEKAGFAKTGITYGVDGAYFFSKHFGIGGLANYTTNGIKNLSNISNGYINAYEYSQVATTATKYKQLAVLGGVYYDYTFGKFSFTARGLAGINAAKSPRISSETWGDDETYDGAITQEKASKTAFALDGGVGLQYHIASKWGVKINADYFYSKPNFDPINIVGINNPQDDAREINSYKEPLNSINLTLGATYQL